MPQTLGYSYFILFAAIIINNIPPFATIIIQLYTTLLKMLRVVYEKEETTYR